MHLRVLHFVRHGQYRDVPGVDGGQLTSVGRRQAKRAATCLAQWPISMIHVSTLARAVESAEFVAEATGARMRRTPLLREMLPTAVPGLRVPLAKRARARAKLDQILVRYFRPTRGVRHEAIVCHGNLIRAVLCLAVDVRLSAWLHMNVHHAGITRFSVDRAGEIRLVSFNDTGHLPRSLITHGIPPSRAKSK